MNEVLRRIAERELAQAILTTFEEASKTLDKMYNEVVLKVKS